MSSNKHDPDHPDWDYMSALQMCSELERRCRVVVSRDGAPFSTHDSYTGQVSVGNVWIRTGVNGRVAVDVDMDNPNRRCVYSSHAQVRCHYDSIEDIVLPLLRARMVLDDLAEV